MQPVFACVLGLLFGAVLLVVLRDQEPSKRMAATGWVTLAVGALAAVALLGGLAIADRFTNLLSVFFSFAGVVLGVGRLVKGDRQWGVWAGTILAGLLAAMWLIFVVGALVGSLFGGGE